MGIISLSFSILIFFSLKNKNLTHNNTMFMFILFSFGIGSIAGDIMKEIVDRARPVVELAGVLSQTELSDTPSFPSGHTVKSMSLALPFLIMALNKDSINKVFKIIVLSFAMLVSISRIALQKHYLSDILAGIAVALFFMLVAVFIANLIYKRRNIDEMKILQMNKRLGFVFIGLAVLLCII
jgi:undecaprenyl-diphosphatase